MIQNEPSTLPWPGVSAHEAVIRTLSLTLKDTGKSVAKVIAAQQKSLDWPKSLLVIG